MTDKAAGERLLVIDDNAGNREIVQRHLQRRGYVTATASDGREGLRMLAGERFDLVLLDVIMEGLDGFGVLQIMKADPAMQEIPVIMMSALDETSSVVRCIQMGAEDYLMKPFDPVLLSARIGASLEKKRLRDGDRRRTEELQAALDQLRQTQDRLLVQENLASLGALMAGIAHEIRNPLNFITNFATASREVLQDVRESGAAIPAAAQLGQLDEYLGKIDEHGKRADRILRSMLMHSRGKSGDRELLDLKNILSDCMNLAYHAARAQNRNFNARLELDIEDGMAPVYGVPQDISRVFLNLLNNAFYAVGERKKEGGEEFQATVAIRARSIEGGIEIRVEDNGPGIPSELLPKIFNPFFTTKPAGIGTGLGLSLSHDIIVRGHGGSMRAESDPGSPELRTGFIVTLPAGAGQE